MPRVLLHSGFEKEGRKKKEKQTLFLFNVFGRKRTGGGTFILRGRCGPMGCVYVWSRRLTCGPTRPHPFVDDASLDRAPRVPRRSGGPPGAIRT